eukprot:Gb_13017 [translate_table: standard]
MVERAGISEEPFHPNNSDGEIILLMIYVDDIIITDRCTFTHRGRFRGGERCMRGRLAQVHFSRHADSTERANDLPGTQSSM